MQATRFAKTAVLLTVVLILSLAWVAHGLAQAGTEEEKIQLGARLFAENCAVCHGPDGMGRVGAVLAQDWPSIRPDLQIKATIERGVPGSVMPAWSQENGGPLDETEIDALVAFILTWEGGEPRFIPPTPTSIPRTALTPPPQVTGDPHHGAELYDQNCAVCHGANGEGRIGATLAQDWPSIRPDLRVKTTIERGVPGSVMPAWSQGFGGPLPEADINDVVAFIMTLPALPQQESVDQAPLPTPASPAQMDRRQVGVILFLILIVVVLGAAFAALRERR